ncbi:lymphotoxin-alpha [Antennarius striatus]|uniref:lymphotoxin-alpha n=1 Tax=Antennarius striatus TaxID=241820 RepID=UPI0035B2D106
MECKWRSSQKHLLLQVWCGLLTVAMVMMAAYLSSIKPKSTEDEASTVKPDISPAVNTIPAPLKSTGSSLSYIQLMKSPNNLLWRDSNSCESCFLVLRDNSIHATKRGLYFLYAQIAFINYTKTMKKKSVILFRNAQIGKSLLTLIEGVYPSTTDGPVWVANIVNLSRGDSVSINITGDFLTDNTFWGAFQLH